MDIKILPSTRQIWLLLFMAQYMAAPRSHCVAYGCVPLCKSIPKGTLMWMSVCLQAAGERAATLQPGANRLAFRLAVMKQGLYVLKHAHCRLGRLALRLRVALPEDGGPPIDALTAVPPALPAAAADAQFPGAGPAFGAVDALGVCSLFSYTIAKTVNASPCSGICTLRTCTFSCSQKAGTAR